MVYEIIWTNKATDSYVRNMIFLEETWTSKEIQQFIIVVQKKLDAISFHPYIGNPRKQNPNTRQTILNKRIVLLYQVKNRKKQIELLLFWNTYQHPRKLKPK